VIDFHSHLDLYPNGLALAREVNERNEFTLAVTTSPRAYYATSRVFLGLRNVKVALGLHPEVADSKSGELDALVGGVAGARFIGEVGLDGSYRFRETFTVQERIFRAVLDECSKQGGRILSIHSRSAVSRVLELLAQTKLPGIPVLHWFSGSNAELQTACDLGCWFSVGPSMLAGTKGRNHLSQMPIGRVLPETDGPFAMTDGVALKPWDAWSICSVLSEVWGLPLDVIEEQMRQNLRRLLST
jgi:TatD DNase family protein